MDNFISFTNLFFAFINCILIFLSFKLSKRKTDYSNVPLLKFKIKKLELFPDSIVAHDVFRIHYFLKNNGVYALRKIKVKAILYIDDQIFSENLIKLDDNYIDILGVEEKFHNQICLDLPERFIINSIINFFENLEEGTVTSEYKSTLKIILTFKGINNKIYTKEYLFLLSVFLHGRHTDYILGKRFDIPISYKIIDINESE